MPAGRLETKLEQLPSKRLGSLEKASHVPGGGDSKGEHGGVGGGHIGTGGIGGAGGDENPKTRYPRSRVASLSSIVDSARAQVMTSAMAKSDTSLGT